MNSFSKSRNYQTHYHLHFIYINLFCKDKISTTTTTLDFYYSKYLKSKSFLCFILISKDKQFTL